jgi:sugar lactone lactonase YvrE
MKLPGIFVLAAMCWSISALGSEDYALARARLIEAYQARDYALMVDAAQDALKARPGFPGALFNLALSRSLDGDGDAALATLNTLADMQIDFAVDQLEEFAPLARLPGWAAYQSRLDALRQPVGEARLELSLDEADFVPEGIAVDDRERIYLGSVRLGSLLRIAPGEAPQILSRAAGSGHWSVLGMRLDPQGQLWFASAGLPQTRHLPADQARQSGLFRLDPASGEITQRAVLPIDGREHVLGDLVISGEGTLYTTDSASGMVYAFHPGDEKFVPLVAENLFQSPQGLALDASQRDLYLADYNVGIFRLNLDTGELQAVRGPDNLSLHGVDGLYFHNHSLIAIQNGIRPNRVVRWDLDRSGLIVTSGRVLAMNLPEFDEPTLGAVHGDRFYFVANSHWNRFDEDNKLPADLAGPIILSVPLQAVPRATVNRQ